MKAPDAHPVALGVHQNSSTQSGHSSAKMISAQQKEDNVDGCIPNIVLFGEPGVGKSSIINLIAGQEMAETSNDALGYTFQHQRHVVAVDGTLSTLLEITGLDEASEGIVPEAEAESNLRSLIQELAHTEGINLVIYCIRANRITKALQDRYNLFYVTICRKKVPIALVVTGLEHQEGEMETWWDKNALVLREYNMRFDAHECVTTLDIEDNLVQIRRSDSQRRLRELVVKYSKLPAWKAEPSFISRILPVFRNIFRGTIFAGSARKSTTTRRVVTCDMMSDGDSTALAPANSLNIDTLCKKRTEWIDGQQYEFVQLDKRYLESPHVDATGVGLSAGALVFYTSHLGNTVMHAQEIDMLEAFYEVAGGKTCPVIVVLSGCDDEQVIQTCRAAIASRNNNIQVYPTTLSDERLVDIIERLHIWDTGVKPAALHRVHAATKQLFMTGVDRVRSAARSSRRRQRQS